jgi:F-type H+-transporting ATPase subunit b
MNINITLIGQMIIFLVFVAFTMKYVWPPIQNALAERQKNIADGLAAAEQGKKELELANYESKKIILDAKTQASSIIEHANQRAHKIDETAQETARKQADKIKAQAEADAKQKFIDARIKLSKEVGSIVVSGAEKIIQTSLSDKVNQKLFDQFATELQDAS